MTQGHVDGCGVEGWGEGGAIVREGIREEQGRVIMSTYLAAVAIELDCMACY